MNSKNKFGNWQCKYKILQLVLDEKYAEIHSGVAGGTLSELMKDKLIKTVEYVVSPYPIYKLTALGSKIYREEATKRIAIPEDS